MRWDVLCPQSGMVLDSFGTLRTLKTHYVCGLCDVTGETDLDDFIQVTFSPTRQLRRMSFHEPGSVPVEDFHWKLRFSDSGRLPGQQGRFVDFLRGLARGEAFLPPGSITRLRADLQAGGAFRRQCPDAGRLRVAGFGLAVRRADDAIPVSYDGQRFAVSRTAAPPGPAIIEIENTGAERGSVLLLNWPPEIVALTAKPVLEFDPYLSGGALLARNTFRQLFRSERVDEKEGSGIRQVTFLFTDLKGSTAMYERLGDLNAYALVREHFALLGTITQEHSGAIVKTIGDAVMAVFSRPTDAVSAALQIRRDIERFNRDHGGPGIVLKIGAHCGSSIAVTLNDNLDYFGQTVNVASRVQALAGAGDICISEALHTAAGVADLLAGHSVTEFASPLRGVEGTARVWRIAAG